VSRILYIFRDILRAIAAIALHGFRIVATSFAMMSITVGETLSLGMSVFYFVRFRERWRKPI